MLKFMCIDKFKNNWNIFFQIFVTFSEYLYEFYLANDSFLNEESKEMIFVFIVLKIC